MRFVARLAHFNSIVLDGALLPNQDGTLAFHRLPSLSNAEVTERALAAARALDSGARDHAAQLRRAQPARARGADECKHLESRLGCALGVLDFVGATRQAA
jgi:hypothetical protein